MSAARSLKARALQWLAQREQSRSELRRKLMRVALDDDARLGAQSDLPCGGSAPEGVDVPREGRASGGRNATIVGLFTPPPLAVQIEREPAALRVEALLDWLEAHDFLSHERFVESRVHARSARFGNLRIRQELKQHQLALPAEMARALNESEWQRARAVRERKFAAAPANLAERARQARYLAGRGFAPDAIARALRSTGRDLDDDEASSR